MKYVLDTHSHTIASGHAYNTIAEMAAHSRNAGAKVVGITNGENAPIYTHCDHCLFANVDNKPYGLSLLKPMALAEELLAAAICGKDGGANEI